VAESFGNILLPIATKIVQKLTVILEKVTNFSDSTKKMILIAGALAAALGPLLIIFGTLSTGIFAAATAMKILGITSLGAAAKTILAWLGAAAPFVAFVALLTSLFLIAEDFYAYLSGKDSITEMVIGPLQEFKDFISDFLTFEGSLRNISVIMSTIFDMLKYIPGFKVAGAFSKSFQNLAANVGTVQPISRNVSNYSSQNVRVNSPITVNVPRGTDPEVIGPVVQESFKNALDSVFRQAYRATAPQQEF
jgi:hypothetical protein